MSQSAIPRLMNFNLGQTRGTHFLITNAETTAWKNLLQPFVGTPTMPEIVCFQNWYDVSSTLQADCVSLGFPHFVKSSVFHNTSIAMASKFPLSAEAYIYLPVGPGNQPPQVVSQAVTLTYPPTGQEWVIFNLALSQGVQDGASSTPFFRGVNNCVPQVIELSRRAANYPKLFQMSMQGQINVLVGADLNIPRSHPALVSQAIKAISLNFMAHEYALKDSYMLNSTTTPAVSNQYSSDYILAPANRIPTWPTNGFSTITHVFDTMPWNPAARYQHPIWDNLIR